MNWHCLAQDAAELLRYKGFKAPIKCPAGLFLSRKHGEDHGRCVLSSVQSVSSVRSTFEVLLAPPATLCDIRIGDIKWWSINNCSFFALRKRKMAKWRPTYLQQNSIGSCISSV